MKKQLLFIALIIIGVVALNNLQADNYANDTQMQNNVSQRNSNSPKYDTSYRNGPVGVVVGAPIAFAGRVVKGTGEVVEDTGDAISGRNY